MVVTCSQRNNVKIPSKIRQCTINWHYQRVWHKKIRINFKQQHSITERALFVSQCKTYNNAQSNFEKQTASMKWPLLATESWDIRNNRHQSNASRNTTIYTPCRILQMKSFRRRQCRRWWWSCQQSVVAEHPSGWHQPSSSEHGTVLRWRCSHHGRCRRS